MRSPSSTSSAAAPELVIPGWREAYADNLFSVEVSKRTDRGLLMTTV